MRVVVIGGTNFIGPHVVTALQRLGHRITVYHRGNHEPELPPAQAAVARFAGSAGRMVALSSGDVYRAYGDEASVAPG